jgi:hypothetical protein
MKYRNVLAISAAAIATVMLIIGGSIMQDYGIFALARSNGVGVGLTAGGGTSYDSSTQANDDATSNIDSGSIQGAGLNDQQSQQGDHNFNNQQYRSQFNCFVCVN